MRTVKIDRAQDVSEIEVLITGPRSNQQVNLIFDTGAALTQIDTGLIEDIGYSISNASQVMSVLGATGAPQQGYNIEVESISFLGKKIEKPQVGVYDFQNFPGVDGLLGWDVIRHLHVEMNGPKGILKVF